MVAIQGVKGTLEVKIDSISSEVTLLRTDLCNMNDKVKENKREIKILKNDTTSLKKQIQKLQVGTSEMAAKLEDLEGRSRRNNIRIVGVPEKTEGQATDLFVEKLITENLQPRGLSKFFSVERAHRIPGVPPRPGGPPRTIIAKFFNFRDRDAILQVARNAPPVKRDNATIRFFPDFTLQVQRARRDFSEVKATLRKEGLQYSMLYSARLRVERNGRVWNFNTPAEAWEWIEGRPPEETPEHLQYSRKRQHQRKTPLGTWGKKTSHKMKAQQTTDPKKRAPLRSQGEGIGSTARAD